MSRVTPIEDVLRYPRDASFWVNPSNHGSRFHKPSKKDYGFAACSNRILLATELGARHELVKELGLLCLRPACQDD